MLRRKKTPTPIQEILNDAWLDDDKGIITNIPYAKIMGTSGQGYLDVNYTTLKKIFGKPSIDNGNGKGSKIRKEWLISIDGVVCTIYDWKHGYDYTKPKGGMPFKHTRWSVGGSHPISRRLVQGVIDSYLCYPTKPLNVVRLDSDIWER
jgi:hypothetical protein